jgi:hypothetical protein
VVASSKGDDGGTSDHWSNPNGLRTKRVGYNSGCELKVMMAVQAIIGAIQMIEFNNE